MSSITEHTSDDSADIPTSREQRLAEYNGFREVLKGIEEVELNDTLTDMDDTEMLIEQATKELERLAESLNAEENDITVTPNLLKVLLPNKVQQERTTSLTQTKESSKQNEDKSNSSKKDEETNKMDDYSIVILYPPSGDPHRNAPFEVLFDNRDWYSCVITEILPPTSPSERIHYKAWILGYNEEVVVCYEELRRWVAGRITSELSSGTRCHVIHPNSGRFVPAIVERLTLDSTAMVRLEPIESKAKENTQSSDINSSNNTNNNNTSSSNSSSNYNVDKNVTGDNDDSSPAAEMASMLEVPLSHVRVGKIYLKLTKKPILTDAEREARRIENSKRRRERIEASKQLRADQVAQDASDWKSLICDMMGSDRDMLQPTTKRRRI